MLPKLLKARQFQSPVGKAVFAMVANRALSPTELATTDWVAEEVFIPGLREVSVQHLYRAMDFLLEANEVISVADLFSLEVDLLYLDPPPTYFEVGKEDDEGLRRDGFSKEKRPDLPQVVITRSSIPGRCWAWPGNTADMSVVEEVKRDLVG